MVWAGENGLKEDSEVFTLKTPYFVELCRYCVFLHFEGLWRPLSKSIFTIFLTAFPNFMSLCDILVILTVFLAFSLLLCLS